MTLRAFVASLASDPEQPFRFSGVVAERERGGAALVIGVHPIHHRVRPPARAQGHLAGAAVLGDVEESQRPLTGAGMRCAQGQVAQIRRRLTPACIVNA